MSLKDSSISGIKWSAVSQMGGQAIQFLSTLIMVRLLSPSDFGLMSMSMLVILFVVLFKDMGTGAAVIRDKSLSETALSSIYWLNVILGLLATLLVYSISHWVAHFFHEPKVAPVLNILAFTFLISGFSLIQKSIMERDLAFNRLAKLETAAVLAGAIVGVTMAALGYGIWSLVFQSMTVTLLTTALLLTFSTWRPKAIFRWVEIQSITKYSLNLSGFNFFNYFARNADDILIGRYLGAQELGYYNLAYRLLLYPLRTISGVVNRVMFPVYSQIQDDHARFRQAYLKVIAAIALITFPLMLGLMVLAKPFVLTVFGNSWEPMIVLLVILAPLGMVQSIGTTVGSIYQAKGRTDWMLRWGLVSGTIIMVSFVIGLKWGTIGVATAYAIVGVILTYPNFSIPFKLIGLSMPELWSVLKKSLLCALLMVVVILGALYILPKDLAHVEFLGILIPLGILTYLIFSWKINRTQLLEIIKAF
jgi:lipopolysaccharide exporter